MMDASRGSDNIKEQQEIAQLIRSGAYFDETKKWYQTLYIAPISERTFFLLIAGLAVMVGIAGIMAVLLLLPVVERPAILISNPRMSEVALDLRHMRAPSKTVGEGVRDFYLKQYVFMRESYDKVNYPKDYAFVRANSDEPSFAAYAQGFDPSNPQSPLVTLGEYGFRIAHIHWVDVNASVEPKVATVRFSTETTLGEQVTTEQWTATIGFYYSELVITPVTDPATGEQRAVTQEPVFKVVSYVVNPASALPNAQ